MDHDIDPAAPAAIAATAGEALDAAALCRGVIRLFAARGWVALPEWPLPDGRRLDVVALAADGTLAAVEIKSSVADFRADRKWTDYLAWCDRFYFAVGEDFPRALLPGEHGLLVADRYGAAELRPAPHRPLAPARRKALTLRFATTAARRLLALTDPQADGTA